MLDLIYSVHSCEQYPQHKANQAERGRCVYLMQEIFGNNITPDLDITVININTRVSPIPGVCNDSDPAVATSHQTFMIKQLYQIVFLTTFSCLWFLMLKTFGSA